MSKQLLIIGLAGAILVPLAAEAKKDEGEPPKQPADLHPLTGYAALPHWPIGYIPPFIKYERKRAAILVWLPPDAKKIRAMFIIPNNSDSKIIGQHKAIKEVAKKHDMGIMFVRVGNWDIFHKLLEDLAERTGIKSIKYAPYIVQGKSSRGMDPINMAWSYPERMIAGLTYHGETPTWPPESRNPNNKLNGENILWCNANGESEWGGTWFNHVRPSLLNYNIQKDWLTHIVVVKDVGHGDYCDGHGSKGWGKTFPDEVQCLDVWDYFAVYIDKALELRVPKDHDPDEGPAELMQVDKSKGWLISPFAVEDLWRQPHYLLKNDEETGDYLVGSSAQPPVCGYMAVAAAKDFEPAEGVPVSRLELGKSPAELLWSGSVKSAEERDPMTEMGDWTELRLKPGDKITIAGKEMTIEPLPENRKGKRLGGGVVIKGLKRWGESISFMAYTILEVPEKKAVKLVAPFSVAGRLQVVLNGKCVSHKQVIDLEKGFYPMLSVLRLAGPNWGGIEPFFEEVSDEHIALARELQKEKDAKAAEQARMLTEGIKNTTPVCRPYADVPEAQRKHMFWVADEEQARAWFKLHTEKVHKQKFPEETRDRPEWR